MSLPPRRSGRGGFDPDAAELDRQYKYRRRRRVLLALLLIGLVVAGIGYLTGDLAAWAGTAVAALLLVGYLAYLRRQVRIEEQIRQRRTARARRARQIRPEYDRAERRPVSSPYMPAAPASTYDAFDDRPAAHVPPAQVHRGRVVVDLDDDDPAFEDLETHRTRSYRRQAG